MKITAKFEGTLFRKSESFIVTVNVKFELLQVFNITNLLNYCKYLILQFFITREFSEKWFYSIPQCTWIVFQYPEPSTWLQNYCTPESKSQILAPKYIMRYVQIIYKAYFLKFWTFNFWLKVLILKWDAKLT